MTISHALITFLIASCLLTITPGLDTMLVLRTAAVSGARRAICASLGICLGLLTWGFSAAVGIGAVLSASRVAYNILRIAGSCYLVFLGCKMFGRPCLSNNPGAKSTGSQTNVKDARRWFTRGLLTNLLNPKVGLFYISFLPLFIPAGVNVVAFSMLLAGVHAAEGVLWFSVLIGAVHPLSHWLNKPRVETVLNRSIGTVFVGFGLKLLLEEK